MSVPSGPPRLDSLEEHADHLRRILSRSDVLSRPEEHGSRSRSAAFFDLDRTLMAGTCGIYLVRAAYAAGMIDRERLAGDVWAAARFRLFGATDAAALKVRARMGGYVEGRNVLEIRRLAPQVMAGLLPRLYPQVLELAYAHQDAGRPVYVCTAASQEIALALALILGFDGAIGSRMEVVDGVFTGREAGVFAYREGKAQAIRELAEEEGIELCTSYGYSDAASDLPMLQAVGIPVAVNPDAALSRIARDAGWEILRFGRPPTRRRIGGALLVAALGGAYAGGLRRGRAAPKDFPRRLRDGLQSRAKI